MYNHILSFPTQNILSWHGLQAKSLYALVRKMSSNYTRIKIEAIETVT